tara:strand:+ start:218 stop:430 length:213 start_codon:yes stop_codon:yes gene_type:complete
MVARMQFGCVDVLFWRNMLQHWGSIMKYCSDIPYCRELFDVISIGAVFDLGVVGGNRYKHANMKSDWMKI